MPRIFSVFALALLTALPALAQQVEVGYASWYNRGFHGLSTASGELYDHEGLTAAHPTLPFGTQIRVTRTDDDRSVVVTVNDRMQSGPGHVIDLSGGAAAKLGLLETGVARVRITTPTSASASADPPQATARPAVTQPAVQSAYTLQLGVFSSRASAEQMAGRHSGAWIQSVNASGQSMYRVYFKGFDSEPAARSVQQQLASSGVDSFLRALQ